MAFAIGAAAVVLSSANASAQAVGTFRWQLQPYCNVLTLTISRHGGVYTLDGFDDQCGADTVAPLTGTAVFNPDGTIELGITIVASPGAAPIHVAVPLNAGTLSGVWKDSAGGSGSLVFTPGAGTGGDPRPGPPLVRAIHVDPAQVQLRVTVACPIAQSMQRINQDGSVTCAPSSAGAGDITAVTTPAGSGLQGGTETGVANLRLATASSGTFDFSNQAGFVARGALNPSGTVPAAGPGPRAMWYPAKAAFRAGFTSGSEFDEPNIGQYSIAMGRDVGAAGDAAIALGQSAFATGNHAVAIGSFAEADAEGSVAIGRLVWVRPADTGAIVIGDGAPLGSLSSSARNQFSARASGGYRLITAPGLSTGVTLAPAGGAWASLSDVNMKENFRDLDGEEVLAGIARMPIREWNYTAQDAAIRHAGPTAQDFYAAFGLGEDPLRISTIDADGIAMRAIQALEARTQGQRARIARIEQKLAGRR